MKVILIVFLAVVGLPGQDAASLPKVILLHSSPIYVNRLIDRCGGSAATFIEGDPSYLIPVLKGDYVLDDNNAPLAFKIKLTLYSRTGDKLTTFDGVKASTLVGQICSYFQGLKTVPAGTGKQ